MVDHHRGAARCADDGSFAWAPGHPLVGRTRRAGNVTTDDDCQTPAEETP
ncbi:Uncharacterised protein [Mycobacteroides abscessus]|nr:Uncharacterised protein [Mycobacteroides abscessus]